MNKTNVKDLLLVSIMPILFVLSFFDHEDIIPPSILLFCALFAVIIISISCFKERKHILSQKDILIIIAIVTSLFTSALSQASFILNGIFYFDAVIQQLNAICFLLIGLYLFRFKKIIFNASMRIISFIGLYSAVYGIIQAITFYINNGNILLWRLTSVFFNPIPAGTVWVMCIFLPLTGTKIPDLFLKIPYVICIFLCQSRSSWLALAIGILIYVIIHRNTISKLYFELNRVYRIIAIVILFILAGILLQLPIIKNIIISRLFYISTGPSAEAYTVRTTHAVYLLDQFIHSNPIFIVIGHAIGSVGRLFRNSPLWQESRYDVVDNTYLSLLYEYGLIMLIAVIFVLFKAIKKIIIKIKYSRCISEIDTTYTLMFICGAITAFFYDVQFNMSPAFLIVLMAATVLSSDDSIPTHQ